MKKILFAIILLFIPFFIYAEECDTEKVNVKSIELIDKSNGVEVSGLPTIRDGIIYLDAQMSYLNDSAEYRVVLENASNQDFTINKNLSNNSKYLDYKLEPADGSYVIDKNSSEEFILTIKYINKVEASDFNNGTYEEDKDIYININEHSENESDNKDPIVNPKTGFDLLFLALTALVGATLLVLIYHLKNKKIYFVLLLGVLLIPPVVKAICSKEIKINSYITINQTYQGMLMERSDSNINYLHTNISQFSIKKIIFTNSLNGHTSDDEGFFDVSVDEDESVLAWASNIDNDGYVTLTIGAEGKVYASSGKGLFSYLSNLESIEGMQYFDTSFVRDMGGMFAGCIKLRSLDLSYFDTSNVITMESMFSMAEGSALPDSSLTSLDLRSFDTSKVTSMKNMFMNCRALTSLNLSSFDTSNVTDMEAMFYFCKDLTSLNLSNFNTSNVTTMHDMFDSCYYLSSLNISSFNTSNVIDMSGMFNSCGSLTTLDLSSFNTSKVINMRSMFVGCIALTSLNLSSFDTSNVTDMGYMFRNCTNLREITVSRYFKTDKVIGVNNSVEMFYGCTSLRGDSGTVYDPNHVDKDYARIDHGTSLPGYFTSGEPY